MKRSGLLCSFLTGAELNARVNECEVRRLNQLNSTV